MAIEDPATVCDSAFQIGEGREAQMIRHMRHGSSPRLMALQPICIPNPRESPAGSISRSPYDLCFQRCGEENPRDNAAHLEGQCWRCGDREVGQPPTAVLDPG